ncbi:MAG: 8-amino-7-oxononanoate synthase [Methylacidiphilales bacterium]|nr:8-amino-7-oxononanoate synthase [Candidatus Methylacidiphilales bacterium]MDW8349969.1 8-amino-7-oxononanoate synthase [Verrucomicrobiae bacterium]
MDLNFTRYLEEQLEAIEKRNLLRRLNIIETLNGPYLQHESVQYLNFGSNDYLGLAQDTRVKEAVLEYLRDHRRSLGGTSSRLITGHAAVLAEAEKRLAEFKGTEAALIFSSGYAMALGVIPALVERGDFILLDRKAHACLIDGARLSEASVRTFPHNDMEMLQSLLSRIRERHPKVKIWIITESLFSMDGDWARLKEIVELKKQWGAWLLVDEAHATGIYGARHRGLLELHKIESEVEVQMGTLGKALGLMGGYIAGSSNLVNYLINRARSFIFSTAPWPALGVAVNKVLEIIQDDKECLSLLSRLWKNAHDFKKNIFGENVMPPISPVFPLILGEEQKVLEAMESLKNQKIWVPAIRYPTVPKGKARLRVSITALHDEGSINRLASALKVAGLNFENE